MMVREAESSAIGIIRVAIRVCAVSLFFAWCTGARAGPRPAAVSAEELCGGLAALHSKIRTWYLEYESTFAVDMGKPGGAKVHRIVAGAPDQYYNWSTHETSAYSWREDPLQQRLTIKGTTACNEYVYNRAYHSFPLGREKGLPGTAPGEFLFVALGWWPIESRPAPRGRNNVPCVLRDIASSGLYTVRPAQELVDGKWCHVLEYVGHDRLWLDYEHGCALCARELVDPATGCVVQRIEQRKHREIKPGIWVPMEFHNVVFANADAKGNRGKDIDAIVKVLNVRINDALPSALFECVPLPGAIQLFDDESFRQTVPGGVEYLDGIVNWIKRQPESLRIPTNSSTMSSEDAIEYTVSILSLVGIFVLLWRREAGSNRLAGMI